MIFEINNKKIHASDSGQGVDDSKETIVFLHGSGLSHIVWSLTEQFFSNKNFNVLSIDLPGHGDSDGPCLESIEKIADWLEEVQALHDKDYKDVNLDHMLADNCAMQLVRNPKQFDVILTDNLFGDMLSDEASMLTGSLGLLPSASLGAKNKDGDMRAMYEPIHGSAPDIAGKGIANPIASVLSFAMALRYSLDLDKEAEVLEKAVQDVLNDGLRTKDILSDGMKEVSTSQMGDAIISKLQ